MPATRTRGSREAARPARPRSDAYTGLLILSLMALTVALVFAYLNWSEYPDKMPKVSAGGAPPPAAGSTPPPAPGPGGPGGPGGGPRPGGGPGGPPPQPGGPGR